MDFQQEVEMRLPSEEGWEWYKGALYRIKQKNSVWYGLQLLQNENQILAKSIKFHKKDKIELIESITDDFLPIDIALAKLKEKMNTDI